MMNNLYDFTNIKTKQKSLKRSSVLTIVLTVVVVFLVFLLLTFKEKFGNSFSVYLSAFITILFTWYLITNLLYYRKNLIFKLEDLMKISEANKEHINIKILEINYDIITIKKIPVLTLTCKNLSNNKELILYIEEDKMNDAIKSDNNYNFIVVTNRVVAYERQVIDFE